MSDSATCPSGRGTRCYRSDSPFNSSLCHVGYGSHLTVVPYNVPLHLSECRIADEGLSEAFVTKLLTDEPR